MDAIQLIMTGFEITRVVQKVMQFTSHGPHFKYNIYVWYIIGKEILSFFPHNSVMREYIHTFVKSQDGFIWSKVKDTGIRKLH